MDSLKQSGRFELKPPHLEKIRARFDAYCTGETGTGKEIARVHSECGVLIDPHTARRRACGAQGDGEGTGNADGRAIDRASGEIPASGETGDGPRSRPARSSCRHLRTKRAIFGRQERSECDRTFYPGTGQGGFADIGHSSHYRRAERKNAMMLARRCRRCLSRLPAARKAPGEDIWEAFAMSTATLSRADFLRAASNPLFNDRKLKLATFSTNLSGGCAISKMDGVQNADWPNSPKRWILKRWFRSDPGQVLAAKGTSTAPALRVSPEPRRSRRRR